MASQNIDLKMVSSSKLLVKAIQHCLDMAEKNNIYLKIEPSRVIYAEHQDNSVYGGPYAKIVYDNGIVVLCVANTIAICQLQACSEG